MNISGPPHWKQKPCIENLEGVEAVSELCRLSSEILGTDRKYPPKSGSDHPTWDPYAGCVRHRLAHARTARTASETNGTLRAHDGAAVLSRSSLHLDALPFGRCAQKSIGSCARGTVSQLHAIAVKPGRRSRAALVHQGGQQVEGDRPDTKIVVPT